MNRMHTMATATLHLGRSRKQVRLAEAYSGLFTLLVGLKNANHVTEEKQLRERISELVRQSDLEAEQLNVSYQDIQNAKFAVIAFLDEVLIHADWPGNQSWRDNPLQLEYYQRMDAGDEFFDRLTFLLNGGPTGQDQVLEVYYLCLALGFKGGKDSSTHRADLMKLKDASFNLLNDSLHLIDTQLSPHGTPMHFAKPVKNTGIPGWVWYTAITAIAVVVYIIFKIRASILVENAMSQMMIMI